VAFPDLLLVDELTLGFAGLRRLASLRQTSAPLPSVLLSDFAMSSVTDAELCSALHIVAVLRLPCTPARCARPASRAENTSDVRAHASTARHSRAHPRPRHARSKIRYLP